MATENHSVRRRGGGCRGMKHGEHASGVFGPTGAVAAAGGDGGGAVEDGGRNHRGEVGGRIEAPPPQQQQLSK